MTHHRLRRNALALCAASLFLTPLLSHADSRADDGAALLRATVDATIRPLLAQYGVPGIAVAVTVDGKPAYFNYGVAARGPDVAVDEHTLFELGSVSKTFAGTLAMYAQLQGKLALSDHPSRFVPALAGSPIDGATLLHLGTYTAGGLPLQLPDNVVDHDSMVQYLRNWQPDAAPGTQRRYSNPSIGLLGHVTALALGDSFAAIAERQLMPALGLRESYVHVPQQQMVRYAWGHDKNGVPVRVTPGVFDAEAYGVKSTAADMARYLQANIAPPANDMGRAVAATHVALFKAGPVVQGMGWEQYPYPTPLATLIAGTAPTVVEALPAQAVPANAKGAAAPTLFHKTGATRGFGAYAVFVPAKRIGVVILANRNFPSAARVTAAYTILQQLDPALR